MIYSEPVKYRGHTARCCHEANDLRLVGQQELVADRQNAGAFRVQLKAVVQPDPPNVPRADLSKHLVHWIKGEKEEDAFGVLRKIVIEQRLLGGNGFIRDGYACVCFTEAPEAAFHQVLSRYRPFGIRVSKKWLFSQGGRPVIYQSADEYDALPESLRWRYVRYEPNAEPPIDFSWEREWRIRTNELFLPSEEVTVVIPNEDYVGLLEEEHFYHEHARVIFLQTAWGELAAFEQEQPFAYGLSVLPNKI